jgi:hypothetical protein
MRRMDVDVIRKITPSLSFVQDKGQKMVSQIIRYFLHTATTSSSPANYSNPILSIKCLDLFFILSFIFTLTNPSRG